MATKNSGAINAVVGLDGTKFSSGVTGIIERLKTMKTSLDGASSTMKKFGQSAADQELKTKLLTTQISLQESKIKTLTSAYEKSVTEKGKDADETKKAEVAMLKAETTMSKLTIQLENTTKNIDTQGNAWKGLSTKAGDASSKMGEHVSNLKNTLLGLATSIAGGVGLFALGESAINTGDAVYTLSEKLHVSTDEASQMSRMLKVTDTDSAPLISTMTRLDKGIEGAGVKGNVTTKALQGFGISLMDAHGKLLPIPGQLDVLAAAYQKAADNGNEEAFSAQVLGAKGQALIPMLQDYTEAKQAAAKVVGIGIDPKEAHETKVQLDTLKIEFGQLGMMVANSVMPIVQAVIPQLMAVMTNMANYFKDHKTEIKQFTDNIIATGKALLNDVTPVVKDIFNFITQHGEATMKIVEGIGAAFLAYKLVISPIIAVKKAFDDCSAAVTILKDKQLLSNAAATAGKVAGGLLAGATKIAAGAQWLFNWAMDACPAGMILLALAAIGLALYYLVTHFNDICTAIHKAWDALTLWNNTPAQNKSAAVTMQQNGLGVTSKVSVPSAATSVTASSAKSRGYALGTPSASPGGHWVGEHEPEWLNFKGGESVTPLSQITAAMKNLSNMSFGGGATTNNKSNSIHIDNVNINNQGDQARSLQMLDFMSAF